MIDGATLSVQLAGTFPSGIVPDQLAFSRTMPGQLYFSAGDATTTLRTTLYRTTVTQ